MAKSEFKFENIKEWERRLKDPRIIGVPLRKALTQSAIYAVGQTQERTPVDTGRLRSSMGFTVDKAIIPKFATIGSNVTYARPVEEGTRPHFPPLAALQPWAVRHGFPGGSAGAFLVARAIAQKGTKGHKMLDKGLAATKAFFGQQLKRAGRDIEKQWARAK